MSRGFQYGGVPHDQGGNQRGEGLIQRVVVGTHAEGHAERGAADLADDAVGDGEPRRGPVQVLERIDGVGDIGDGPVEFLFGVAQRLADFPHEEPDHLGTFLLHVQGKSLDMLDPVGNGHGRPCAASVVISLHGSLKDHPGGILGHEGEEADGLLFETLGGPDTERGMDLLNRAVPEQHLAPGQILPLPDRLGEPKTRWDLLQRREDAIHPFHCGHGNLQV